ncbi:MAG: SlyX family protein [Nitratireductor sp.]
MSSKSNNELENRLVDLEELNMHQAKTIDELSHMVSKQWTTIDALEKKVSTLVERFLALEETAGPAPEITKPPHY